jgi:peptidylprolyl isomerase
MTKKTFAVALALCLVVAGVLVLGAQAKDEPATKKEAKVVSEGSTVKVNYTLTVEGAVVDSSEGKEPLEFTMGSGQLIPGFEKNVTGMKVGEKKSFEVDPADGYGEEDPRGYQEVPKDKLPADIEPKAGMTLYAQGQDGKPIPVQIKEVKDDVVVLNFNHPLAGKTLNFAVEVVDIK